MSARMGFGPDLMLRAFEQVGSALVPCVVVVALYTDDFRRVRPEYAGVGFEIPRFALQSGDLVSIDYPRPRGWMRWSTVAAVREAAWRFSGTEWALNEAILDRFRDYAARAPFKLALVFLPGVADTPNDQNRRAWLRAYAGRTEVPYLDLTDHVLRAGSPSFFIANDTHYNPQGHTVVAREIQRWMTTSVLGSN